MGSPFTHAAIVMLAGGGVAVLGSIFAIIVLDIWVKSTARETALACFCAVMIIACATGLGTAILALTGLAVGK